MINHRGPSSAGCRLLLQGLLFLRVGPAAPGYTVLVLGWGIWMHKNWRASSSRSLCRSLDLYCGESRPKEPNR